MKSEVMEYVSEEEAERFASWAFGDGYRDFETALEFMKAWNERHGDKLRLSPEGEPDKDVPKMIDAWKDSLSLYGEPKQ